LEIIWKSFGNHLEIFGNKKKSLKEDSRRVCNVIEKNRTLPEEEVMVRTLPCGRMIPNTPCP
jgi:hypothetical protein